MAQRRRLGPDPRRAALQFFTQPPVRRELLAAVRTAVGGRLSISASLLRHVIDSLAEGVVVA